VRGGKLAERSRSILPIYLGRQAEVLAWGVQPHDKGRYVICPYNVVSLENLTLSLSFGDIIYYISF